MFRQAVAVGQGINLVVGVANNALATTVIVPPGYENKPLAIHTPQLQFMGKVHQVFS